MKVSSNVKYKKLNHKIWIVVFIMLILFMLLGVFLYQYIRISNNDYVLDINENEYYISQDTSFILESIDGQYVFTNSSGYKILVLDKCDKNIYVLKNKYNKDDKIYLAVIDENIIYNSNYNVYMYKVIK